MTLGAHPHIGRAIGVAACDAGMRLDIALVRLFGPEVALDDHVGLCKARVDIPVPELGTVRHVRRFCGLRFDPAGEKGLIDQRCIGLRGRIDIDDMRQDFVFDLDQFQRFAGGLCVDGGHRGDSVAIVESLGSRHAVVENVQKLGIAVRQVGQVCCGDDGLDAFDRFGAGCVDPDDPRMGMRAAQYAPDQLTRHVEIRTIARAPGDLVDAIGPQRTGTDRLELLVSKFGIKAHDASPLISAAASATARTILSYPVHRHRFPASQNLISSSVGDGFASRSALAAIRKPGVHTPH